MNISMYQASVPRFLNMLGNLSRMLDKAQAHAAARKFDGTVLAASRLFPDMLPLSAQVQIACDTAKGAVARLAGIEIPVREDTEKTLDELRARVAKTMSFIETMRPEGLDGSEDREIVIRRGEQETRFTGIQFLLGRALPISTSTSRRPTTSSATTESRSARRITSAIPSATGRAARRRSRPRASSLAHGAAVRAHSPICCSR